MAGYRAEMQLIPALLTTMLNCIMYQSSKDRCLNCQLSIISVNVYIYPPQDEAAELLASEGQSSRAEPEEALAYLSQHCELAVVTLGDKGCIAQRQGDLGIVQEHACSGVTVLDATGGHANPYCATTSASESVTVCSSEGCHCDVLGVKIYSKAS